MNIKGKILYIFEPHTYSRTKILLNDFISVFSGEDVVFYKTYPARESYDYLGSSEYLAKKLNAKHFDNFNYLINNLINNYSDYSAIFILGAGDLCNEFINYYKN